MSVAFNMSCNGGHDDADEETTSIKARYFDYIVLNEDERVKKDLSKAVDIAVFKEVYAPIYGRRKIRRLVLWRHYMAERVTAYAGLIASKGRFVGFVAAATALGTEYKSYVLHLCNNPNAYTNDRKQLCAAEGRRFSKHTCSRRMLNEVLLVKICLSWNKSDISVFNVG